MRINTSHPTATNESLPRIFITYPGQPCEQNFPQRCSKLIIPLQNCPCLNGSTTTATLCRSQPHWKHAEEKYFRFNVQRERNFARI